MSVQIDLPVSLEEQVKMLAEREGVSVDEFISIALAEKVATLETAEYLSERAKRRYRPNSLGRSLRIASDHVILRSVQTHPVGCARQRGE